MDSETIVSLTTLGVLYVGCDLAAAHFINRVTDILETYIGKAQQRKQELLDDTLRLIPVGYFSYQALVRRAELIDRL